MLLISTTYDVPSNLGIMSQSAKPAPNHNAQAKLIVVGVADAYFVS